MGVNWKGILGGAAPILAKALTGGAPAAAAAALQAASRAVLGHAKGSEDEVAAALQAATPEQLLKLKELEQEYAIRMLDSVERLEAIDAGDRANARAREIATHDWVPAVLAIVLTIGMGVLVWVLSSVEIPAANREPFMLLVGTYSAAWGASIAYYFGSSSGSRANQAAMRKAALG